MATESMHDSHDSHDSRAHARELPRGGRALLPLFLVEVFGAFALTFVDAGGAMVGALSSEVTVAMRSAAAGLTIMAMIYALGDVSGAHFNPVVTLSFAARRVFPWRLVPMYLAAQFGGAIAAALLLRALLGDVAHLGANEAKLGAGVGLAFESVLTLFLVLVVLCTSVRHKSLGASAAIAVGGTVAMCNFFSKPVSGASMNAARSFGPALVSGHLEHVWIYFAGSAIGAAVAFAITYCVHRHRRACELEAAAGEKGALAAAEDRREAEARHR